MQILYYFVKVQSAIDVEMGVVMLITKNTSKEKIRWLISQSNKKIANCLKDLKDGHIYNWPARMDLACPDQGI